jgi:hypothetical protein
MVMLNLIAHKAEAGLLNKRLMLSSSFRCDQIYMYEIYDFGHTVVLLKSDNKPASVAQLMLFVEQNLHLAAAVGVNKFVSELVMN